MLEKNPKILSVFFCSVVVDINRRLLLQILSLGSRDNWKPQVSTSGLCAYKRLRSLCIKFRWWLVARLVVGIVLLGARKHARGNKICVVPFLG